MLRSSDREYGLCHVLREEWERRETMVREAGEIKLAYGALRSLFLKHFRQGSLLRPTWKKG